MVLTPLLVGDRIGLHPVAVIFAVLAGGQLFGFLGVYTVTFLPFFVNGRARIPMIPVLLLVALGFLFPGFDEPVAELDGQTRSFRGGSSGDCDPRPGGDPGQIGDATRRTPARQSHHGDLEASGHVEGLTAHRSGGAENDDGIHASKSSASNRR